MSYHLSVWMDKGRPYLGITDSRNGEIKQLWQLHRIATDDARGFSPRPSRDVAGTRDLIRSLFKMGTIEALARCPVNDLGWNTRCLNCDACLASAETLTLTGSQGAGAAKGCPARQQVTAMKGMVQAS